VDGVLVPYGNKKINSKKKKLGPPDVVKVVKMDVTGHFASSVTYVSIVTHLSHLSR
jgi:hypothetical protein